MRNMPRDFANVFSHVMFDQLEINYDKLSPDDRSVVKKVIKKSPLYRNTPLSKRTEDRKTAVVWKYPGNGSFIIKDLLGYPSYHYFRDFNSHPLLQTILLDSLHHNPFRFHILHQMHLNHQKHRYIALKYPFPVQHAQNGL